MAAAAAVTGRLADVRELDFEPLPGSTTRDAVGSTGAVHNRMYTEAVESAGLSTSYTSTSYYTLLYVLTCPPPSTFLKDQVQRPYYAYVHV